MPAQMTALAADHAQSLRVEAIQPEKLEEARSLGERMFRQEDMCEFIRDDTHFSRASSLRLPLIRNRALLSASGAGAAFRRRLRTGLGVKMSLSLQSHHGRKLIAGLPVVCLAINRLRTTWSRLILDMPVISRCSSCCSASSLLLMKGTMMAAGSSRRIITCEVEAVRLKNRNTRGHSIRAGPGERTKSQKPLL